MELTAAVSAFPAAFHPRAACGASYSASAARETRRFPYLTTYGSRPSRMAIYTVGGDTFEPSSDLRDH